MGILSSIDIDFWRSLFDSPLKVIVNSLDILIVAFLIYRFIRALRGTKIMTLVQGVVLFILVKLISDFIGFTTISYLMNQVATGIPLDAVVTGELLINIFIPNTPLHDGAVIIRDNKVATACSYLPLTESNKISKEFGTRHRAAIGLSEQTDALTFVVSEETGAISIAYKGNFIHDLSIQEFEEELSLILLKEQEPRQSFFQRWIGGSKK